MALEIESRSSDSPYIERVWRSRSSDVDQMTSIATAHWDLVFWEHRGQVSAAVQGPESRASVAQVPEDATFFGISFSARHVDAASSDQPARRRGGARSPTRRAGPSG